METPKNSYNKLYTPSELSRIIGKYEALFNLFNGDSSFNLRNTLWIKLNDRIVNIKRWLADSNKQIFWDYLSSTHRVMEERLWDQFDPSERCRCIQLFFKSGKVVTFSKDANPTKQLKWIISLEKYFHYLNSSARSVFDRIFMELGKLEFDHFKSKEYNTALLNILSSSPDELTMALNLQEN